MAQRRLHAGVVADVSEGRALLSSPGHSRRRPPFEDAALPRHHPLVMHLHTDGRVSLKQSRWGPMRCDLCRAPRQCEPSAPPWSYRRRPTRRLPKELYPTGGHGYPRQQHRNTRHRLGFHPEPLALEGCSSPSRPKGRSPPRRSRHLAIGPQHDQRHVHLKRLPFGLCLPPLQSLPHHYAQNYCWRCGIGYCCRRPLLPLRCVIVGDR